MERLTTNNKEILPISAEHADYWMQVYCKLKKYEEAEEQGALLRPPCKVGDKVFLVNYEEGTYDEDIVRKVYMGRKGICIDTDYKIGVCVWSDYVFFSEEEAIKMLEGELIVELVEFVPVTRAEWEDLGTIKDYPEKGVNNYHLLICSKCGCCHRIRLQDNVGKPFNANFCPNCGAYMRLEGNENNEM